MLKKISKRAEVIYEGTKVSDTLYKTYFEKWFSRWKEFQNKLETNLDSLETFNWDGELIDISSELNNITSFIQLDVKETLARSTQLAQRSRRTLIVVVALAILIGLTFSLLIVNNIRRLFDLIHESKTNIETMLNNLDQGFLVINQKGFVEAHVSRAAETLFGQNIANKLFAEVIPIPDHQKKGVKDWIEVLFDGSLMDVKTAMGLAPKYFFHLDRYVQLEFKPILDSSGQKALQLICVATDKTVERKLRRKADDEAQVVKVIIAYAADQVGFRRFVNEFRQIFKEIQKSKESYYRNIEPLLRYLHTLKGGLAACEFSIFAQIAHDLESDISDLRGKNGLKPHALEAVLEKVFELEAKVEAFLKTHSEIIDLSPDQEEYSRRISKSKALELITLLHSVVGKESKVLMAFLDFFMKDDFANLFERYENMVNKIAERQFKKVKFFLQKNQVRIFPEPYLELASSYIHVLRNAIDHGIEDTFERTEKGKEAAGNITVSFSEVKPNTLIRICVEDDGRGIDLDRVKSKAIKNNLISESAASHLSPHETLQLLFYKGFSTNDEVTDLSGRGVGLDVLKTEVDKLSGRVWIESTLGKGTRLIAEMPYIDSSDKLLSAKLPKAA